jgi:hypothetical protein
VKTYPCRLSPSSFHPHAFALFPNATRRDASTCRPHIP